MKTIKLITEILKSLVYITTGLMVGYTIGFAFIDGKSLIAADGYPVVHLMVYIGITSFLFLSLSLVLYVKARLPK